MNSRSTNFDILVCPCEINETSQNPFLKAIYDFLIKNEFNSAKVQALNDDTKKYYFCIFDKFVNDEIKSTETNVHIKSLIDEFKEFLSKNNSIITTSKFMEYFFSDRTTQLIEKSKFFDKVYYKYMIELFKNSDKTKHDYFKECYSIYNPNPKFNYFYIIEEEIFKIVSNNNYKEVIEKIKFIQTKLLEYLEIAQEEKNNNIQSYFNYIYTFLKILTNDIGNSSPHIINNQPENCEHEKTYLNYLDYSNTLSGIVLEKLTIFFYNATLNYPIVDIDKIIFFCYYHLLKIKLYVEKNTTVDKLLKYIFEYQKIFKLKAKQIEKFNREQICLGMTHKNCLNAILIIKDIIDSLKLFVNKLWNKKNSNFKLSNNYDEQDYNEKFLSRLNLIDDDKIKHKLNDLNNLKLQIVSSAQNKLSGDKSKIGGKKFSIGTKSKSNNIANSKSKLI